MEPDGDWEITEEGLYRATRGFLVRRGHCCGNRCSNCPYINWRMNEEWQPAPAQSILRKRVSPRSIEAARTLLAYHQRKIEQGDEAAGNYHQTMVQHYHLLLERWGG
jgi:Family of unknown function (DUF5522)